MGHPNERLIAVELAECKTLCLESVGRWSNLTYDDLARVTGYSRKTLYNLAARGLLTAISDVPKRFDYRGVHAVTKLRDHATKRGN